MKCMYCKLALKKVFSTARTGSIYVAPAQIYPGRAGAFCSGRTDIPNHAPEEAS